MLASWPLWRERTAAVAVQMSARSMSVRVHCLDAEDGFRFPGPLRDRLVEAIPPTMTSQPL